MAHPGEFFANFRESLLNFVEEYGILPRRILVSKEETLQILEPIASILSIRLDMVELLEAAEEFKGEFLLFSYYSTQIMHFKYRTIFNSGGMHLLGEHSKLDNTP